MSNPLAATSVATKMSRRPSLNFFKIFMRRCCVKSPWIPAALYPLASNPLESSSTRRFVRPKTIVNSGACTSRIRVMISNFSYSRALTKYWSTKSVVSSFALILTTCGSCMNFSPIERIAFGIVAEKSSVCLSSGTFLIIDSMSSKKPMSSISSASSKTSVLTCDKSTVLRLMWSSSLPGVPTKICGTCFKSLIWRRMSAPP